MIELNGGQTYYIAVYPGSSVLPQSLIIEGPLEPAQSPGSPPIDLGAAQRYEADISLREGDGVGDDFFWFENWHWTPGSNGTVTIDVAGILSNPSSFSVYRGTTVTPANLLEEIEFKGGTIELAVTAGQTYTLVYRPHR